MRGEAIEILLAEDDPDHAELINRGLVNNLVANRIHHVPDGEPPWITCSGGGNMPVPRRAPVHT